jgi:hypothetical protein
MTSGVVQYTTVSFVNKRGFLSIMICMSDLRPGFPAFYSSASVFGRLYGLERADILPLVFRDSLRVWFGEYP